MNLALKFLDIIEENGEAKMIGDEPFETDENEKPQAGKAERTRQNDRDRHEKNIYPK